MHFLGGKSKIATDLAQIIHALILPEQTYLEPFVGAAHVLSKIKHHTRIASDIHPDLIMLLQGIQDGSYTPPAHVTEEEYNSLMKSSPSAHRGLVGFGCGYAGIWFGGYCRNTRQRGLDPEREAYKEDFYVSQARRSLLALRPALQGVTIACRSYDTYEPHNSLIYCDPPYFQTEDYTRNGGTPTFDHDRFWDTITRWAENPTNTVLSSEWSTSTPTGVRTTWCPVWAARTRLSLRAVDPTGARQYGWNAPKIERLFAYEGAANFDRIRATLQEGALFAFAGAV